MQHFGSGLNIFSGLFLSSLVPVKMKSRLTKKERGEFVIPENLNEILVGLLLGDLYIQKHKASKNPRLVFLQGTIHKDYIYHLYDLFQSFCLNPPKVYNLPVDKRTGKIYSNVVFRTYSLPCFTSLYSLFYPAGKKQLPLNIAELLTSLSLAYWICDDGGFDSKSRWVKLSTQGFSLDDVNLLVKVLNDKFHLDCVVHKDGNYSIIGIPSKSLPLLQNLLAPHMPSMMRFKIGLD
jgi:hypothetical protein